MPSQKGLYQRGDLLFFQQERVVAVRTAHQRELGACLARRGLDFHAGIEQIAVDAENLTHGHGGVVMYYRYIPRRDRRDEIGILMAELYFQTA